MWVGSVLVAICLLSSVAQTSALTYNRVCSGCFRCTGARCRRRLSLLEYLEHAENAIASTNINERKSQPRRLQSTTTPVIPCSVANTYCDAPYTQYCCNMQSNGQLTCGLGSAWGTCSPDGGSTTSAQRCDFDFSCELETDCCGYGSSLFTAGWCGTGTYCDNPLVACNPLGPVNPGLTKSYVSPSGTTMIQDNTKFCGENEGNRNNGRCKAPSNCCSVEGTCARDAEHCITDPGSWVWKGGGYGGGGYVYGLIPGRWVQEQSGEQTVYCGGGVIGSGACFNATLVDTPTYGVVCCSANGYCGTTGTDDFGGQYCAGDTYTCLGCVNGQAATGPSSICDTCVSCNEGFGLSPTNACVAPAVTMCPTPGTYITSITLRSDSWVNAIDSIKCSDNKVVTFAFGSGGSQYISTNAKGYCGASSGIFTGFVTDLNFQLCGWLTTNGRYGAQRGLYRSTTTSCTLSGQKAIGIKLLAGTPESSLTYFDIICGYTTSDKCAIDTVGHNDADRGYYDVQCLGIADDYCRNLVTSDYGGAGSANNWFACKLAGHCGDPDSAKGVYTVAKVRDTATWCAGRCSIGDLGRVDSDRGWYDVSCVGVLRDFCRNVGTATNTWFSCKLSGSCDEEYSQPGVYTAALVRDTATWCAVASTPKCKCVNGVGAAATSSTCSTCVSCYAAYTLSDTYTCVACPRGLTAPAGSVGLSACAVPSNGILGCFKDCGASDTSTPSNVVRDMSNMMPLTSTNTYESCAKQCSGYYTYFGVQNGNQCYCGVSYGSQGASTDCITPCSSDSSKTCGGPCGNTVAIVAKTVCPSDFYRDSTGNCIGCPSGFSSPVASTSVADCKPISSLGIVAGCWADCGYNSPMGGGTGTVIRDLRIETPSSYSITHALCAQRCQGYKYYGVQDGIQCFCGDSYGSQGPQPGICTILCKGNSLEVCGGSCANTIGVVALTPSSTALNDYLMICSEGSFMNAGACQACPLNKTSPLGSTNSSACVDPTDGIIGCFTDCGPLASTRDLTVTKNPGSLNTYASCAAQCFGYTYFGVEYGRECRCGNSYGTLGVPVKGSITACNVNCPGDYTTMCGGGCAQTIGLVTYYVSAPDTGLRHTGVPCSTNSNCLSHICFIAPSNTQQCDYSPGGGQCGYSSDCGSNLCISNSCVRSNSSGQCSVDADCNSGLVCLGYYRGISFGTCFSGADLHTLRITSSSTTHVCLAEVIIKDINGQSLPMLPFLSDTLSGYPVVFCIDDNVNTFCHSASPGATLTIYFIGTASSIDVKNRLDDCCRYFINNAIMKLDNSVIYTFPATSAFSYSVAIGNSTPAPTGTAAPTSALKAPYTICASNSECLSNVCKTLWNGSVGCDMSVGGGKCIVGNDCGSGSCSWGFCAYTSINGRCAATGDCTTGLFCAGFVAGSSWGKCVGPAPVPAPAPTPATTILPTVASTTAIPTTAPTGCICQNGVPAKVCGGGHCFSCNTGFTLLGTYCVQYFYCPGNQFLTKIALSSGDWLDSISSITCSGGEIVTVNAGKTGETQSIAANGDGSSSSPGYCSDSYGYNGAYVSQLKLYECGGGIDGPYGATVTTAPTTYICGGASRAVGVYVGSIPGSSITYFNYGCGPAALKSSYAECGSNAECLSNICKTATWNNNALQCDVSPGGGKCIIDGAGTMHGDCGSGKCVSGICGYSVIGGQCAVTGDCTGGLFCAGYDAGNQWGTCVTACASGKFRDANGTCRAATAGILGCYQDNASRDLRYVAKATSAVVGSDPTDYAYCASLCKNAGYLYFGAQFGYQCFCSNAFGKYGKVADSSCSSICYHDPSEKCGGSYLNTVGVVSDSRFTSAPTAVPTAVPTVAPTAKPTAAILTASCPSAKYVTSFVFRVGSLFEALISFTCSGGGSSITLNAGGSGGTATTVTASVGFCGRKSGMVNGVVAYLTLHECGGTDDGPLGTSQPGSYTTTTCPPGSWATAVTYSGGTYLTYFDIICSLTSIPTPTSTPTAAQTPVPTPKPTSLPTVAPTTVKPTTAPTAATSLPTVAPTTVKPTIAPTTAQTSIPTSQPTSLPTVAPTTVKPTIAPTAAPSPVPTPKPTSLPTVTPSTIKPTTAPTAVQTPVPTPKPTSLPTVVPTTVKPTIASVTYQCATGFVIDTITLRSSTALTAISSYSCKDANGNFKTKSVGVGDSSAGTSVSISGPFSAFSSGYAVAPDPADAASGLSFVRTDGSKVPKSSLPPYGTGYTGVTTKSCPSGQVLYGFSLATDSSGTMVGGNMTARCRDFSTVTPTAVPTTAIPTFVPTTSSPTTAKPATVSPTTPKPSTANPTTVKPSTAVPTTVKPSTVKPSTALPTTVKPTFVPSTSSPTTVKPSTAAPSTPKPNTAVPTTVKPSTASPTTPKPTTPVPTTVKPSTLAPTTVQVAATYQCATGFVIDTITLRSGTGLNAISSYNCKDSSGNYKTKTVGVGDISAGTSVTISGPFSAFSSGYAVSPDPTDAASGLVLVKSDGSTASSTPSPPYGTASTGVTTKSCSSGKVLSGFSLATDSSGTMVGGNMTAKCRDALTVVPTPTPSTSSSTSAVTTTPTSAPSP